MKKYALLFVALVGLFVLPGHSEKALFLADDTAALRVRADIVAKAEKEILVEYFTIWNDDTTAGGLAMLLNKARQGVEVKIIADSLSTKLPAALLTKLQEMSIDDQGKQWLKVKMFNPFNIVKPWRAFYRNHSKQVVVDGKHIVTGGRNLGNKYFADTEINENVDIRRKFLDIDIYADGIAAEQGREDFYKVWNGKLVEDVEYYSYKNNAENISCNLFLGKAEKQICRMKKKRLLRSLEAEEKRLTAMMEVLNTEDNGVFNYSAATDWMGKIPNVFDVKFIAQGGTDFLGIDSADMAKELIKIAKEAKESIDIFNPYLIPPEYTKDLLEALIKRQNPVKIRIITNSMNATDNYFVQIGYQKKNNLKRLTEIGIELYEYNGPVTMHAKAALIDNKTVIVGSFNMDPRSARINREVGIVARGPKNSQLVKAFHKTFDEVKADSLLVAAGGEAVNREERDARISTKDKIVLNLLSIIYPFIKNQL